MKLISWNVNGIRAVLKKGFMDFFLKEKPDIMCIQETKAQDEQVQILAPGYFQYWCSAQKKGYSGTAIFTKIKPLSVSNEIDGHDTEGRVITMEFDEFYLVNVYTPNSQRGLTRIEYRQEWDREFLQHVVTLQKTKPVIFCGDLNVAHQEIDIARPKDNMTTTKRPGNPGFTDQERAGFDRILEAGFVDTFRQINPDKVQYSWWAYMFNAREKNIGWRIDYFLISEKLKDRLKDAFILDQVMGSDHCPVGIDINI